MVEGGGENKANGRAPAVFISYASQDAALANSIVESLEQQGLRCWLAPRDVRPGALYADAIVAAINEAQALVLVLSGSAVTSSHVSREVERAASKRKPMIAFRIDAAPLSRALEYFLGESQWIDARALGMPAALAKLAETVAQGLGQTAAVDPVASAKPLERTKLMAGAAVVISVAIAVAVGAYVWSQKHEAARSAAAPAITDKSVAVLPFLDMSEKKDQEYLSDGLSEELIDTLTKVPELRVPARTSSFYFKGKQATLAEIGKALSVAHVLEGSVQKSGDKLRITAQLVSVDSGYHLWSQAYDRKADDIFKIEDEISSAVAAALKASLLAGESPRTTARSAEAHALVLEAQYLYLRSEPSHFQVAADYFQQAISLDPNYAAAWAGLSKALGNLPGGWQARRERAAAAAERALALDPKLAEAHIAMGKIYLYFDFDWTAADREFRQALALEPSDASALHWGGIFAWHLGRFDDALSFYQQSLAVDPLNPRLRWLIGLVYLDTGRPTEAETSFRRLLELDPANTDAIWGIGMALVLRGEAEAGIAQLEREADQAWREYILAIAYYILGRKSDSNAAVASYELQHGKDAPYNIACLHAQRGELNQAFTALQRALEQRDQGIAGLIADRFCWKAAAGDPRYESFLRKMKVPGY